MHRKTFELVLSGIPYEIKTEPFSFNGETRFKLNYNNGPDYIFVWDREMLRFKTIEDDASEIPDDLELAISEKLQEILPLPEKQNNR